MNYYRREEKSKERDETDRKGNAERMSNGCRLHR